MRRPDRTWLRGMMFTIALIGLIAVASFDLTGWPFVLVLAGMVMVAVTYFYLAFPGSEFFVVASANALGVLLLLFGSSEIMSCMRERRSRRDRS